ncbi:MAG: hypothetical protein AAGD25_32755, partial [Cyanobacteria bacterium P01_F01_bin.150]
ASSVNAGVGDTVEEGVIMVKVQITTTLSLLPFLALLLSPQRVFELLRAEMGADYFNRLKYSKGTQGINSIIINNSSQYCCL